MFFKKKFDIVAIGDTVTDAFIKLKEAHVNCKINTDECEICMKFGDKIPFESVEVAPAVGNSANAVVSASRLGLKTTIITNLGDDQNATDAIEQFKKNGVDTSLIKRNKGMKTNYHYVLWFGAERTILIKHEKYPYILPKFHEPKYIYLSSLGEHSLPFHEKISEYLKNHPRVKLVFQPGTYQIKFGIDKLREIYARTEIFFCNKEEARRILNTEESDIKKLMESIANLGPKVVVITDGPKGAYVYSEKKSWFIKPYPDPKEPFERTGAGDAFASTFTSALILGKTIEESLLWAPINSMSVVQDVGAQKGLLSKEKLEEWLKKAPEDYKPKEI